MSESSNLVVLAERDPKALLVGSCECPVCGAGQNETCLETWPSVTVIGHPFHRARVALGEEKQRRFSALLAGISEYPTMDN